MVWLGIYDLEKNRLEFYPATSQAGSTSFRNVSWQPKGDYVVYTPSASGVSDTLNIFNMATKKVSRIKRDSPGLFKTIMWVNDNEFISPVDNQYERCSITSMQCRVIYDAAK